MDIIGAGSERDRNSIPLGTIRGSFIPNERRMPRAPATMIAAKNIHLGEHPEWRLRSLSSIYNCMGMVFASRRTWIEPEHFSLIVEEDGYRQLTQDSQAQIGDVAVYTKTSSGSIVHVGVIISIRRRLEDATTIFEVLSQFGAAGEYLHQADDLPECLRLGGVSLSIWTEAKT